MLKFLQKPASAIALSLSIALAAISLPATPARADTEQIVGILAGLAALYAIGRAIDEHNDRDRSSASSSSTHTQPRPQQQARVAPAQCFRDFGAVRGYAMRCMENRVSRPALLPSECLVRVNTDRGPRNLYAGRCLHRNGWVREAGFRP